MAENKKITFNLAAVEREGKRPDPYVVALDDGDTMTLVDPQELSSDDLLATADSPVEVMRLCCAEEDRPKLKKLLKVPAWKLNLLMEDFTEHYGLDRLGNGRGSRG